MHLSKLDNIRTIGKESRHLPMFRYIPSRIIMQRIIMRATKLPDEFEDFELD